MLSQPLKFSLFLLVSIFSFPIHQGFAHPDSTCKRWTIQTGIGWYYYSDYDPNLVPAFYHKTRGFVPPFRVMYHNDHFDISVKYQQVRQAYITTYTWDDYFPGLLLSRNYLNLDVIGAKPISLGPESGVSISPGIGMSFRRGGESYLLYIYQGREVVGDNQRSLDVGLASQLSIDDRPLPWLRISLLPGYNYYFFRSKVRKHPEYISTAHEWFGMLMVGVDF